MAAIIPVAAQLIAAAAASAAGIGGVGAALIIGGAALLGGYIASELFGSRDSSRQEAVATSVRGNYFAT